MLKSCQYCGRIHPKNYDCGRKPKKIKRDTKAYRFHRTQAWQDKSIDIRERDHYLCQCCIRLMPGTMRKHNYDDLSVHHIEPLATDYDQRLDDNNLITVCGYHHELAERGEIDRELLHEIAREQNEKREMCV